MAVSPAHFYAKHLDPERPVVDTAQFKLGRLVHTAVLEPHKLEAEYVIEPPINKRTKAGKAEYDAFIADAGEREVVAQKDVDLADAMREAVMAHPNARPLLEANNIEFEVSGWWQDERTGQTLKYRPDARLESAIIDLKTTAGPVDYDTVQKAVARFFYHSSASHYLDGDRACFGTDHDTFILIFVSKDYPHEVGVYYLDSDAIALGRLMNRTWLHRLVDCLETNEWPSVNDGQITELSLPPWELKKLGA